MGNLKGLTQKLFNKLTALVRIISAYVEYDCICQSYKMSLF